MRQTFIPRVGAMLSCIRKTAGTAIVSAFAALLSFVPGAAVAKDAPALAVAQVVSVYHRAPDPAAAEAFIRAELDGDQLAAAPRRMRLTGFVAGLVATDPAFVDRLAPMFRALPGDQPLRLVRAVAYSGRADWSLHAARLKNLWPERAAEIEMISAKGGRPVPRLTDTKSALVIDLAAGYYGATGDPAAIERIVAALPTHRMTQSSEELLVAQAARWYLAGAVRTDPAVRTVMMAAVDGPHGEAAREILGLPAHPGAVKR